MLMLIKERWIGGQINTSSFGAVYTYQHRINTNVKQSSISMWHQDIIQVPGDVVN